MPRPKKKLNTSVRTLQDLALGEDEALLYTLMLSHPKSTVQELTARTPFPRTLLYYILKKLEERELVTSVKDGARTVFIAEDPERLYDLLTKKEQEFERENSAVRELIPRLKNQYHLAGKRPTVRTFEGVEEYRKALGDILLSAPKEILSYEVLGGKKPAFETREAHDKKRVTHKIQKNILFFEDTSALSALKNRKYDDYTQYRSIKESIAPFATDIVLYSDKLLYTSAGDAHEPTAVLVEDQALYEMQKSLFESLWKQAKDRTLAYTENI